MKILDRSLTRQFFSVFMFCVLGIFATFIVVDLVENLDKFLDHDVPFHLVLVYYLFYTPYIVVLTLPVASLMATTFLIGGMAKNNEIVALKGLGYSLYQVMTLLLIIGLGISMMSFILTEGVVAPATRKRVEMEKELLKRHYGRDRNHFQDLKFQDQPDRIVWIGEFQLNSGIAKRIIIETYENHQLVYRIDAPVMFWRDSVWQTESGYSRRFKGDAETAVPIFELQKLDLKVTPAELVKVQVTPEEMSIFELYDMARRIRLSGGEIHKWETDLHLKIAFPLSNLFVIFLCTPMVYNRRKKSLAVGFGISLLIVFIYFGIIKMGQTMGHKRELAPFLAAWMGNLAALGAGFYNLHIARK